MSRMPHSYYFEVIINIIYIAITLKYVIIDSNYAHQIATAQS